MTRRSWAVLAAGTLLAAWTPDARAAANPAATVITVRCGILDAQKPQDTDHCEHFDVDGNDKTGRFLDGYVEIYSGNTLVVTEHNPWVIVDKGTAHTGTVDIRLTGDGNKANFTAWYVDTGSSVFNAPDLSVKVWSSKGSGFELSLYQKYDPTGSALWSLHSGDSVALQGAIDAEVAARKAADAAELQRATGVEAALLAAINAETLARQMGDQNLEAEIAAEALARQAAVSGAIATANAYTDANLPLGACPAGQAVIATTRGGVLCAPVAGGGANLPKGCLPNQIPIANGNDTWSCGNICNNVATNVATDVNNCGSCGTVCAAANATPSCVNGACGFSGQCNAGFADCDKVAANGCESQLANDNNNCGGCGNACPQGKVCINSQCQVPQIIGQLANTQSAQWSRSPFHSGMTADPVTGKYYFWPGYAYDGQTIYEYNTEQDLINNSNGRAISMPSQYEGTYHASLNGVLYYNTFNTNTLVAARASDGGMITSFTLAQAGHTNQSCFNWGGYSDISFYVDAGNKMYLLWAPPGGQAVLSDIDPATLQISNNRTLPVTKGNMGWAFVAGGNLYYNNNYSDIHFNWRYDINLQQNFGFNDSFTSTGSDYITHTYYNPAKQEVLEHTQGINLIYPNIFH